NCGSFNPRSLKGVEPSAVQWQRGLLGSGSGLLLGKKRRVEWGKSSALVSSQAVLAANSHPDPNQLVNARAAQHGWPKDWAKHYSTALQQDYHHHVANNDLPDDSDDICEALRASIDVNNPYNNYNAVAAAATAAMLDYCSNLGGDPSQSMYGHHHHLAHPHQNPANSAV
ncbi:hypothetical protein BaRGS_00020030, partial [Batillaria attramentaria]